MVKPLGIAEISANTSKFAESDWDSASHRRYIKKAVWNESRWLHNAVYVVDCSTSVAELVVEYSEPTAMSAHLFPTCDVCFQMFNHVFPQ